MTVFTLYSRQGCHLCEQMIEQVMPLLRGRIPVEVVDIDGDPTLRQRFDIRIPVLCQGDRVICEGLFDADAVHLALRDTDL